MTPCNRHAEDLALIAGGDLDDDSRQSEALAHAETCAACAGLLAALGADRELIARAATAPESSSVGLAATVLARLSAEAHVAADRPRAPRRSADLGLVAFGRAAAAAVIVISASVLGLGVISMDDDGSQAPGATASSTLAVGETLPVHVRRSGHGVELTWPGDGRERGSRTTYRVLASGSPRDFTGARPVEVAGHRLIADGSLPAGIQRDRSVTFFRVE